MSTLHDFFAAAVGAAAALIGLLFVAITIAPERVFGERAEARRSRLADGAFGALSNVFFVSLAALVTKGADVAIAVVALISLSTWTRKTLAVARSPEQRSLRAYGLFVAAVYVFELVVGLRGTEPVTLAYVMLILFAYALGCAWQLLGAERDRA